MWPFDNFGPKLRVRRVQRVGERFPTDLLSTELGEVADISAHGLRIRVGRRPDASVGQVRPLTIRWSDFGISVKCRVVRVVRVPPGGTEVGVSVVGASPRLRAALEHLGQYGFVPRGAGEDADGPSGASAASVRPAKRGPDYYRLLGLPPSATAVEIRQAYHRLARQHHPDASNDAGSARTFEVLTEAYRILRDAESRRRYDAARATE